MGQYLFLILIFRMLVRFFLFMTAVTLFSCSTNKGLHKTNVVNKDIIDDMFYNQAKFNDLIVTNHLAEIEMSKSYNKGFTSFEVMFFFNKLRQSSSQEILRLFQKSDKVYSIEYVYNRELYGYYWNNYGSISLKRKSFASKTELMQKIKDGIPDFEMIKERINAGDELDTILNDIKSKYDYVHKKSIYILSKYESKNTIITNCTFSIW